MNIYDLVKNLSLNKNSLMERNKLIEIELKKLYLKEIPIENIKTIKENRIIIKSIDSQAKLNENNSLILTQLYTTCFMSSAFSYMGFLVLFFAKNIIDFSKLYTNGVFYFSIFFLFISIISLIFTYKIKKEIKKEIDFSIDNKEITTEEYMNSYYKNIVKKLSLEYIKQCDSITEPELQIAKNDLSEYLTQQTFSFVNKAEVTIFDKIEKEIQEQIFIPAEPLKSKEIKTIENNKENSFTLEQMKKDLFEKKDFVK